METTRGLSLLLLLSLLAAVPLLGGSETWIVGGRDERGIRGAHRHHQQEQKGVYRTIGRYPAERYYYYSPYYYKDVRYIPYYYQTPYYAPYYPREGTYLYFN